MKKPDGLFVSISPVRLRRSICVWGWLFVAIGLPVSGISQSFSLGFTNEDVIPKQLVDTADYSMSFMLVNTDNSQAFTGPVDVMMSVEGDEPWLLTSFNISTPLLPGDSVKTPAFSHHFNEARFTGGGGLTYDIIVWPMSAGIGQSDSLNQSVSYTHTQPNAQRLQVVSPSGGVPGEIIEGEVYDLIFTVINRDTTNQLYNPVSISLMGDGLDSQELIINQKLKNPVLPGDSVSYLVPAHSFDIAGGGGGLTYDIIVWPMSVGTNNRDSLYKTLRIYDGAAIEMVEDASAPLGDPTVGGSTYEVDFTITNRGIAATTEPVDFIIEVEGEDAVVFHTLSGSITPAEVITVSISDLRIMDYLREDIQLGAYPMTIYAQERNTSNWLEEINKDLVIEPLPSVSFTTTPEQGRVETEWTLPYDVNTSEYELTRTTPSISPKPVFIGTIPGISSPEIPVTYSATDLSPVQGLSEYRLVKRNLLTNERVVLARKDVRLSLSQFVQQQVLSGQANSPQRTISIPTEYSGADARIAWYDATGRQLGKSGTYLAHGNTSWTVMLPESTYGVIYWSLRVGNQQWSGRTFRQ